MLVSSGRRWWLAVDEHPLAPVISFHRAVHGKTHLLPAWDRRQVCMQLAKERFQLVGLVAGHLGVDMQDVAIRGDKTKVLVLHVAQATRQQASSTKQHHGK